MFSVGPTMAYSKHARLGARRWAKNDSVAIKQFFQRLSVALQRGNAALLVNRDADVSEF